MTPGIISSLKPHLENAHRIVETVVIRSTAGAVYTISVGESLLPDASHPLGAKVTLLGDGETHVGICEGATVDEILESAQELIAKSIQSGGSPSTVPKPHSATAAKRAMK